MWGSIKESRARADIMIEARMFSAILLVRDDGACASMERLAVESTQVCFEKTLPRYPSAPELTRLINTYSPKLVFLDLSEQESALAVAADLQTISPQTAVIGFGAGWNNWQPEQYAAAGINELLVSPVTLKNFQDCVDRAIHKVAGGIQENLFVFLPAKAGSGSTTIALNTAGYLADLSKKVLLIDGDLNSGVASVLLGLKHPYSLRHALDDSEQLDYPKWTKFIATAQGFDLLLSDHRRRAPLPLWSNYHHLLDFAATRYDTILMDLPEVVNDATVETVRRARRVFIACTPEPASLALAPCRCEELISRGIPAEKISLVLNRWHKGEISASTLEARLKHSVAAVFGNDYRTVSTASGKHGMVDRDTKLGRSFTAFAKKLAGVPEELAAGGGALAFLKGLGAKTPIAPRI